MITQETTPKKPQRLLRRRDVAARLGVSLPTLYRMIDRGDIPRPVQLGPRAVRFRSEEIDALIDALPRAAGDGSRAAA